MRRPDEPSVSDRPVGVSNGIRTRDILDHNQTLYRLSYTHHRRRVKARTAKDSIPGRPRIRETGAASSVAGRLPSPAVGVGRGHLGDRAGVPMPANQCAMDPASLVATAL